MLDVSAGGVLVEGEVRLLPGTHVDVHVVTPDGRLLVRSRVVRAYVSRLSASGVTYRGAFAFERSIEVGAAPSGIASPGDPGLAGDGYGLPVQLAVRLAAAGTTYPERAA